MRQFIYLSNSFCRDVFPDNNSGQFTNLLNEPIPPQHSISITEIYYKPMEWYNIRRANNKIVTEFSEIVKRKINNHWGELHPFGPYRVKCRVTPGLYTSVFDLMRAVVSTMNDAAVDFFRAHWKKYGHGGAESRFGEDHGQWQWDHRTGEHALEVPRWELVKYKLNVNEARAVQDLEEYRWIVPPEYDPNIIY